MLQTMLGELFLEQKVAIFFVYLLDFGEGNLTVLLNGCTKISVLISCSSMLMFYLF